MPSSALIRVQQPSLFNQKNYSNNSEKHSISMPRLFLYMFDYIYVLNTRIILYFLLLFKRLLRFLYSFWTFVFVSLRGSKKTVRTLSNILQ
jgi:hypothetical protein